MIYIQVFSVRTHRLLGEFSVANYLGNHTEINNRVSAIAEEAQVEEVYFHSS
jgi:hypothetical protein